MSLPVTTVSKVSMVPIVIRLLVPSGRIRGTVSHPVAWQQRRPSGSPVQTLQEEKQNLEEVRSGPQRTGLGGFCLVVA